MATRSEIFKDWYTRNAKRISEQRKELYATDEEYRKACLERARERRARVKVSPRLAKKKVLDLSKKAQQDGLVTRAEACDFLGIDTHKISNWRRAGYIPSGTKKYSKKQLELLALLRETLLPGVYSVEDKFNLNNILLKIKKEWQL